METRILMEVEEMISKVREQQGRAFDVKQLTTSCVANVVVSMLFGRRFDHSDAAFQQLISNYDETVELFLEAMAIDIFPLLRFVPYFSRKIARAVEITKTVHKWIEVNIASNLRVSDFTMVNLTERWKCGSGINSTKFINGYGKQLPN